MSMVTLTFESFECRDCGATSPGSELRSFNTLAPPPSSFTYDGTCINCGSKNTEEVTGIGRQNQDDQL